jgi:hypothetical protein
MSALAFSLLAAGAWAQEEAQAPEGEKVVITGQRPGPGLWKVSKGEHVMYVFADYSPLPVKMDWRSHEVEKILSTSQEYLPKPMFGLTLSLWGKVKALPLAIGFEDNPDGARLVDVLPAETYDRWQVLKAKYIGKNDGIERQRPIFAADKLYRSGLEKNGLTSRTNVTETIGKIAQQYKVRTTSSSVENELEDPYTTIKAFKNSSGSDVKCFVKTVDQLESDIDAMRVRANAWAVGDMTKIASLDFAERAEACKEAFTKNAAFKSNAQLQSIEKKLWDNWLANAERALGANNSTFAVLSLHSVLDPKGPLAELKSRGYKVEAPE